MPIAWSGMATEGAQQDEVCRLREKLRRAREIMREVISGHAGVEQMRTFLAESGSHESDGLFGNSGYVVILPHCKLCHKLWPCPEAMGKADE